MRLLSKAYWKALWAAIRSETTTAQLIWLAGVWTTCVILIFVKAT